MRYYLLTHHGLLLAAPGPDRRLVQIELAGADRATLVSLDIPPELARRNFASFIAMTPAPVVEVEVSLLGHCQVALTDDGRAASVQVNGFYLTAEPDRSVANDRGAVNGWEQFLLLSDLDLDFIAHVRENRWVVKSTRRILNGAELRIEAEGVLALGSIRLPLRFNLPFDFERDRFRFTGLVDGWKIEQLALLKPLIFYVAVGDKDVLTQLYLSLNSLMRIGNYDGDVLLFTDKSHAEVCEAVPSLNPARLEVVDISARDWIGFVAGKYCVLDHAAAYLHQPVIYMDPDIIFNRDQTLFLSEIALADRIGAPIEHFSKLDSALSVGALLLQLDNSRPPTACGFNAGTICIPNIPAHLHTLELIRRVLQNYLTLAGRGALNWVDQEIANYVSYKLADFDTNLVSRYVQHGWEYPPIVEMPLIGLVHFWPVPRHYRHDAMRIYHDWLLSRS